MQIRVDGLNEWIEALDSIDGEVRRAAAERIRAMGGAATAALHAAAHTLTPRRCWQALSLLQETGDTRWQADLGTFLESRNPLLGQTALKGVDIRLPEHITLLLDALPRAHHMVQPHIILLLGRSADRRAVAPLLRYLRETEHETIRYNLIEALGLLGDPQAVDAIRTFSDDPNHHVRERVQKALKRLGTA
jgi:HEAT repeat protein